jgi:hypothetical protein
MLSEALRIAVLGSKLSHHDDSIVADFHVSVHELAIGPRLPQAFMKPESSCEPSHGALEIFVQ